MPEPTQDSLSAVTDAFVDRHIGPDASEVRRMLDVVGVDSLDELVAETVPQGIRDEELELPEPLTEAEVIARLRTLAEQNDVFTSLIGCGYHDTITPPVVRRNILENPAWYTAYTPYQPEISQGRLEALLNFQTMVSDLSGLPLANASLLDEATAAAEAMVMLKRLARNDRMVFRVDADVHPQSLAVIHDRAEPIGVEVQVADRSEPVADDVFGVLYQYPGTTGEVYDLEPLVAQANEVGALTAASVDLLALVLLRPPGDVGVDVVVGSTQRFGVPMGCGGPHAAFITAREGAERQLPGRVVGVSIDAEGRPALRLALQTREQHIRRDKATSNICTAQVLLAVMASMYACWHGPEGLRAIAERVHGHAGAFAAGARAAGLVVRHESFFDTVAVEATGTADAIVARAAADRINLRPYDADTVVVSFDETTTPDIVARVLAAFEASPAATAAADAAASPIDVLRREDTILDYAPFHRYRSETEMLRYIRALGDRDLALDRTMIPLGSCTMKLNATTEMEPVSWPEFANLHPFAPADQRAGTVELVAELETWLTEITGYGGVSIQPNAGSQGELAGLLAIRAWHRANGDAERDICLIPASAHGTNAASAVMAGMRVLVVACNDDGDVDLDDLRRLLGEHEEAVAALMITYPSTHGVFEAEVTEVCAAVHDAGGQVYLDGANLNALVGLARPGRFGADVSHLNLHKTFCIPHGGGGPGVGPVAVAPHLVPFLPSHPVAGDDDRQGPTISAAPWGSAGILQIPYAYIAMMGAEGLRQATKVAILSANYIAARLESHFPVLYRGDRGRVAHECILDLRPLRDQTGVTVDDVAKRLIDYGFHAPTMSFPVAGTLMVEPTESESLEELDRFCAAMIAIAEEAALVASGEWPADDNPLVHAPHTAEVVSADEWKRAYPRSRGAWPAAGSAANKYWSPVARIDGAHGDRNFVCSCPPLHELAESGAST